MYHISKEGVYSIMRTYRARAKQLTGLLLLFTLSTGVYAMPGAPLRVKNSGSLGATAESFSIEQTIPYYSDAHGDLDAAYAESAGSALEPLIITADELVSGGGDLRTFDELGMPAVYLSQQGESASWQVSVPHSGYYTVGVTYLVRGGPGHQLRERC